MFVDAELLHSGADESHRAGEYAQDGADRLSRGPLVTGMFGDFAAAQVFHDAVIETHAAHVRGLRDHRQELTALAGKVHFAAVEFTEMDRGNAVELGVVRCGCDT
ncbi:DUF2563 family protein [Mycobacterium sp.]|uniref:DUF2563 family protein n=1 Tax=Mycobacterium sp. TaxID=1785 RepID=UPI003BAA861A